MKNLNGIKKLVLASGLACIVAGCEEGQTASFNAGTQDTPIFIRCEKQGDKVEVYDTYGCISAYDLKSKQIVLNYRLFREGTVYTSSHAINLIESITKDCVKLLEENKE